MKSRCLTVLLVLLLVMTPAQRIWALDDGSPEAIVTDTLIVRPACFVVTTFGCVFFVVALPFAAISGSVKQTGNAMVVIPGRATFTRELGNFTELK